MAGFLCVLQTGEIALTGSGSPVTILQLTAPTNQLLRVKEWSVSCKGTSNTQSPVKVDLLYQTAATGTLTTQAPVAEDAGRPETPQATGKVNATAEPTAGNVLASEEVHPQTGYTWQAPYMGEKMIAGAKAVGIRVNANAAVTVEGRILYEE